MTCLFTSDQETASGKDWFIQRTKHRDTNSTAWSMQCSAVSTAQISTLARTSSRWSRLVFDGDKKIYELWETKFLGHLRLQKLKDIILTGPAEGADADALVEDAAKNAEAYAELIQFLDNKSLSLVMREAADDGRGALKILRDYYAGRGKPHIVSLYTKLTSLQKMSHRECD